MTCLLVRRDHLAFSMVDFSRLLRHHGKLPRQSSAELFRRHPHPLDTRESRDLAGYASTRRAPDVFRRPNPARRAVVSERVQLWDALYRLDSCARRLGNLLLVASLPDACRDPLNLPRERQTPAHFAAACSVGSGSAAAILPWRRTRDPYAILVSEFMLQQTQVATVIPFYERWLQRFPDFSALAQAKESDVLHAWQGLGYYARARNLHAAAKFVRANLGGQLPASTPRIAQLPGVGRYTAGAIASFAFDLPEPIVEANIGRVLARLTNWQAPIDSTAGSAHLWQAATALLPRKGARAHNSALMDLGALVCVPRQPRCGECPVRSYCRAEGPEFLPVKRKRPRTVALFEPHDFRPAPQPRSARTIERSLARNVDPAPSRAEPEGRSAAEDRFPIHSPPRHARRFRRQRNRSRLTTSSAGFRARRLIACLSRRPIGARSRSCSPRQVRTALRHRTKTCCTDRKSSSSCRPTMPPGRCARLTTK